MILLEYLGICLVILLGHNHKSDYLCYEANVKILLQDGTALWTFFNPIEEICNFEVLWIYMRPKTEYHPFIIINIFLHCEIDVVLPRIQSFESSSGKIISNICNRIGYADSHPYIAKSMILDILCVIT